MHTPERLAWPSYGPLRVAICDLPPIGEEIRIVRSHSPVAQLVEQPAVNRLVVGSSPTGGAGYKEKLKRKLRYLSTFDSAA